MALRLLTVVFLVSLTAAAELPDMSAMHAKCYSLLHGMSSSAYSKTELAMICRSMLPMEACSEFAKELGEKPWSPSTIGRTCGRWEEQWADRALQMSDRELQDSVQEWQAQVDDIMKKKTAVGVCNSPEDKPTKLEDCTVQKNEEFPKYTKELNDALQGKYKAMQSGAGEKAEEAKKQAEEKVEEVKEQVGATRLHSKTRPVLGMSSGFPTVAGLAGASLVVMVLAFVAASRRARNGAVRVDSETHCTTDAEMLVQ